MHAAHISAANRLASNRLAVARAVGGGGGGALPLCAYWVCVIFKPFSVLNFRSRADHFHKQQKIHSWSGFYALDQSISILEFLPFQRSSFSTFCYLQPVSSLPTANLLRPARTRSVWRALLRYSGPECSPGDHQFHAVACARDPHFFTWVCVYLRTVCDYIFYRTPPAWWTYVDLPSPTTSQRPNHRWQVFEHVQKPNFERTFTCGHSSDRTNDVRLTYVYLRSLAITCRNHP